MPERYKKISVKSSTFNLEFEAKLGFEFEIENADGVFSFREVKKEQTPFFCFMDEEKRKTVEDWLKNTEATDTTRKFRNMVEKAVTKVNYDFSISTVQPLVVDEKIIFDNNIDGKYQTKSGITKEQWEEMALSYSPEHKSTISSLSEILLWYAWRCANGEISEESITEVAKDTLFEPGKLVTTDDTKAYILVGCNSPDEEQKNAVTDTDFIITEQKLEYVYASVTLLN